MTTLLTVNIHVLCPQPSDIFYDITTHFASAKEDSELGAVRTKLASTQVEVQSLTHQLSGSRSPPPGATGERGTLSQCRQLLYFCTK